MNIFKVGDNVRTIEETPLLQKGALLTIVEICELSGAIQLADRQGNRHIFLNGHNLSIHSRGALEVGTTIFGEKGESKFTILEIVCKKTQVRLQLLKEGSTDPFYKYYDNEHIKQLLAVRKVLVSLPEAMGALYGKKWVRHTVKDTTITDAYEMALFLQLCPSESLDSWEIVEPSIKNLKNKELLLEYKDSLCKFILGKEYLFNLEELEQEMLLRMDKQ